MEDTMNKGYTTVEGEEESKFAAVVFHNVQEIYVPGKDIRCCYSIKPSVSPTPSDWIGLFKVGWQCYKDYLCYEYSPMVRKGTDGSRVSSQNSVLFRGSKLPQEENEFYQFCYVSSDGEIRGASYPFQIQLCKPGELECNEEEGENGDTLLVVRNKTTMLEDSLAKAYDENAALKASKEKAEADCILFQDIIQELESQKNKMVSEMKEQIEDNERMTSEKQSVEEALKKSVEMVKVSEQALQEAKTKVLELQKAVEVEKVRSVQTNEDEKKLQEERMQLLRDISDVQSEIDRLNILVEEKDVKISTLQEKIEKISQENKVLVKENENLLGEMKTIQASLKESKQECLALEKSLSEQLEQRNMLQNENFKINQELRSAHAKIDELSVSFDEERNLLRETHLKEVKGYEEVTENLMKKFRDKDRALVKAGEEMQDMYHELEEEKAKHRQLIQEYENSLSNIQEQLNRERAFNNSLTTASDRQVAELQEQLNDQLQKSSVACQQIEEKTQEIKRLEEDVKAKETVIAGMERFKIEKEEELQSAKNQAEEYLLSKAAEENNSEKNSALAGPYFALQKAHVHLEKQYRQAKKDMENLWRQKSDLKRQLTTLQSELPGSDLRFQMANLKKQIEDLRIRLNMGAEAYKAKFKECRKYQNQLEKVQKTDSGRTTPQSPSSVVEFEIRNLKQSLENEKTSFAAVKKSLDNYKKDACERKQELEEVKKENEALRRKVSELEANAAITNEEKEKRLDEDKELQSHIECLHRELQTRTEAMKNADEHTRKTVEEKDGAIAALTEKNQSLHEDLEKSQQANEKLLSDKDVLQEEVVRCKKVVEDLHCQLLEREDCVASLLEKIKELESNCRVVGNETGVVPSPALTNESDAQVIPAQMSLNEIVCPVCSIFFPPNCSQHDFEEHVHSHFKD